MAHQPPVPPDQQSDIVHGAHSPPARSPEVKQDPAGGNAGKNLSEQDRFGGVGQNTHHQGYQQDR